MKNTWKLQQWKRRNGDESASQFDEAIVTELVREQWHQPYTCK